MAETSEETGLVPLRDPDARRNAARVYSRTLNAEAASKATGLAASTIRQLALHDEDFKALVDHYAQQTAVKVLAHLTHSAVYASKVLRRELRRPKPDSVRVRVAKTCLEQFFRASEAFGIERRLAALELGRQDTVVDAEIL